MKRLGMYIAIGVIYILLIYLLPGLLDVSPLVVSIVLIVVYFIAFFAVDYFMDVYKSEEKFEKSIIKAMTDEGFECTKREGVFMYLMNGRRYRAYFWKTGRKSFRTLIVDNTEIGEDGEWESISYEGRAVIANYVNNECYHTAVVAHDSGVSIQFITSIDNPKDFLEVSKQAYRIMGETVAYIHKILPDIKNVYARKENDTRIGFVQNKANS